MASKKALDALADKMTTFMPEVDERLHAVFTSDPPAWEAGRETSETVAFLVRNGLLTGGAQGHRRSISCTFEACRHLGPTLLTGADIMMAAHTECLRGGGVHTREQLSAAVCAAQVCTSLADLIFSCWQLQASGSNRQELGVFLAAARALFSEKELLQNMTLVAEAAATVIGSYSCSSLEERVARARAAASGGPQQQQQQQAPDSRPAPAGGGGARGAQHAAACSPAPARRAVPEAEQAAYATWVFVAHAMLELWRSAARVWPRIGVLVDTEHTPFASNAMAVATAAITRLCVVVLASWPGPAPQPDTAAAAAKAAKRLAAGKGLELTWPVLPDAQAVDECLRDAAFEALCIADRVAYAVYDEVLSCPVPLDVAGDEELASFLSTPPLRDLLVMALPVATGRLHSKSGGVSPVKVLTASSVLEGGAAAAAGSSSSGSSKQPQGKKKAGGGSSSSKASAKLQAVTVPPYHKALVATLALDGLPQRATILKGDTDGAVVATSVLAYVLSACTPACGLASAALSNFWVKPGDQIMAAMALLQEAPPAPGAAAPRNSPGLPCVVLWPLATTVLQALLLAPDLEHMHASMLATCVLAPAVEGGSRSSLSSRGGGDAGGDGGGPSLLWQPLMHLVAPAVLNILHGSATPPAHPPSCGWDEARKRAANFFAQTLALAVSQEGPSASSRRAFHEAVSQHPLICFATLDAALRLLLQPQWGAAAAASSPSASSPSGGVLVAPLAACVAHGVRDDLMIAALGLATGPAVERHMALLALFSLLLSLLKVTAHQLHADAGSSGSSGGGGGGDTGSGSGDSSSQASIRGSIALLQQVVAVQSAVLQVSEIYGLTDLAEKPGQEGPAARRKLAGKQQQQQRQRGGGSPRLSDVGRMCLVVAGRCACLYGTTLEAVASAAAAQPDAAQKAQRGMQELVPALQSLGKFISEQTRGLKAPELVGGGFSAAAMDAAWQSFAVFEVILQPMVDNPDEPNGQLDAPRGVWRWLPADLASAGQELCSALPTPHCCNNPWCASLAELCEMHAASGRARACGGLCGARYCCRTCQEQHWLRGHRGACKGLAHEREAAAAAAAAAGASK